jgi:hypothetical protein
MQVMYQRGHENTRLGRYQRRLGHNIEGKYPDISAKSDALLV